MESIEEEYQVFDGKNIEEGNFIIKGNDIIIPTEEQIVKQLCRLANQYSLQAAATLSIIYITCSRLEEVIKYNYVGTKAKEIHVTKRPFCFGDVRVNKLDGETWIQFPTRVLKNFRVGSDMLNDEREKLLIKTKMKLMEIPLVETHPLYPLLDLIERYMESVVGNKEEGLFINTPFWNKSKRVIQHIAKKKLGIKIHWLRHWRSKHLVENYGYSTPDLMEAVQWSSPMLALKYSESRDSVLRSKQLEAARFNQY